MTPRRKFITVSIVLGAASAVGGSYAVHWYKSGRFLETTDNACVKADRVDVRPQMHGRITAVLVADDQVDQAGQPLVRIDAADFCLRLTEAAPAPAQRSV